MFLENDFARPLFDFVKGGPPRAYECLVILRDGYKCGKVTRTENGMRMHLKRMHKWKEQSCLYSTDNPTDQKKGSPRKLRTQPIIFPDQKIKKDTEKTLPIQKSQETSEGELLNFTREEK